MDPFARSLANLESVLGQFFLAITVARLATLELQGIEAVVGSSNFYERVTDGVHAWQQAKERRAAVKEPVRAAAFDR